MYARLQKQLHKILARKLSIQALVKTYGQYFTHTQTKINRFKIVFR